MKTSFSVKKTLFKFSFTRVNTSPNSGVRWWIIGSAPAAETSLADLNARLERPVPVDRFRPNLVVRGCEPYAEDGWRLVRIGRIPLRVIKPCARCTITTVDQQTATSGKEPLRTLARFRRAGNKVLFGQNLIHDGTGTLHTGDPVEVLQAR